jgi:hypothetical protein
MSHRLPIWVSNTILLCFTFISLVFVVVHFENAKLKREFSLLPKQTNAGFATIQEISRARNQYPIIYQCHYSFSLQDGSLAEASETIPYIIYKKLKLGDPIEIYRMETYLFGRKIALSKISENDEQPPLIENLERFFRGGVFFFAIISCLSILFRVLGSRFQTYRSQ